MTEDTAKTVPTVPLVQVERLYKSFMHEGQNVQVLSGVDLSIRAGEMVSVVGASGAGKSTLLHLIGTLDLPSRGHVYYNGRDVTNLQSRELAKFRNSTLGFVFQFHHLLPEFDALENVMMPGLVGGARRREIEQYARELLEEVGLGHRLSHRPGELSGGEQQRVALARALVMRPKLVLADEPTGNLDSKTSDVIHELFFEMNRRHGTTFLIVTHSKELAGRMPRIVTMSDGKIVSDSAMEGVLDTESDAPAYRADEPTEESISDDSVGAP